MDRECCSTGMAYKNFMNAVIHSLGIMNGNIYDGIIKIVKRLFEVVKFVANHEPYGLKRRRSRDACQIISFNY